MWKLDTTGRATISILRTSLTVGQFEAEHGFVAATIDRRLRTYSCYVSLNCSTEEFNGFLNRFEVSLIRHRQDKVDVFVIGDFNIRLAYCRDRIMDSHGNALCNLTDATGLLVVNNGREPTSHSRGESSVIDPNIGERDKQSTRLETALRSRKLERSSSPDFRV